jgi:hypothetical protein
MGNCGKTALFKAFNTLEGSGMFGCVELIDMKFFLSLESIGRLVGSGIKMKLSKCLLFN